MLEAAHVGHAAEQLDTAAGRACQVADGDDLLMPLRVADPGGGARSDVIRSPDVVPIGVPHLLRIGRIDDQRGGGGGPMPTRSPRDSLVLVERYCRPSGAAVDRAVDRVVMAVVGCGHHHGRISRIERDSRIAGIDGGRWRNVSPGRGREFGDAGGVGDVQAAVRSHRHAQRVHRAAAHERPGRPGVSTPVNTGAPGPRINHGRACSGGAGSLVEGNEGDAGAGGAQCRQGGNLRPCVGIAGRGAPPQPVKP
ncbi:hypothetical protein D3C75_662210 [compost metagenome]